MMIYGQSCEICVKAVYPGGYSIPVCLDVTSAYLYPVRNPEGTLVNSSVHLTWLKPVTMSDAPDILSIKPRTLDPDSPGDADPAGGPYLWVHTQTGSPEDQVEKWKITGTSLSNNRKGVFLLKIIKRQVVNFKLYTFTSINLKKSTL
jgi:hypothetical protein